MTKRHLGPIPAYANPYIHYVLDDDAYPPDTVIVIYPDGGLDITLPTYVEQTTLYDITIDPEQKI